MIVDDKAQELAAASIGQTIRLEIREHTIVQGPITECKHVGWVTKGKKNHARFKVTIMAGKDNKYEYKYHVHLLPSIRSNEVPEVRVEEYTERAIYVDC